MTPLMTGSVLLRRVATLAALMLGALTLVGCTGAEPAETGLLDPLSEAVNPDASNNERVRAILAARAEREAGEIERERYREVLKSIAWKRSNFAPVRIAAIEALAADGPDDTARMLALLLPTEPSWDVIEASGELAAEQGWNITTSGLVRSWSREVQEPRDADRPERAALLALHPDRTDVEIVYNVFARPDVPDTFRQRTRREAWALLTRLDEDGERIRELLTREDRSDDPLIVTLRRGARELAVVPRTPTSLQRLERLYEKHEDFRQRAASVVASLNDAQRRGLELRHLAPLLWTERHEPAWLDADSAELISLLEARLDGRDTFKRTSGWSDRMSAPDETVQEWREDLVWADLLTILIADGAVRDPAVIEAVFRFQVQDRRDRSTELGGLIDAVGDDPASSASPRFVATLYEPRPTQRSGDQAFIAPVEMLSDAATALLCFHMQVQSVNNVEFAGPSQGDIAFARAHALSCVVFTSISGSAMNVDYYQGDGARIDLGAVRR
jgi:hypothetical protein